MVYSAILIASAFLLLAFVVERLSPLLHVPSVFVLVVIGFGAKPLLALWGYTLDGLDVMVPIVGAIGLVLIVLEGAFDIKVRRSQLRMAGMAMGLAFVGLLLYIVVFAALAVFLLQLDLFQSVLLAVPFAVISSAVAIPSSKTQPANVREFVVYESSMSDILGVLVFFALLHSGGTLGGLMLGLVGGSMLSLLLSIVCSVGLVLILMRLEGHIRFVPLLAGLFGLYATGELLHLSPLIMVLLFGLVLNNPSVLTRFSFMRGWMDESYEATLDEFKVLVQELTFAVRGFFFILLGYWTELSDLTAWRAWAVAVLVLAVIYGGRYALLRLVRHQAADTLLWIAPRGLITVLLFLHVKDAQVLPGYFGGAVVIVVLVSAAAVALARPRPAQLASYRNVDVAGGTGRGPLGGVKVDTDY